MSTEATQRYPSAPPPAAPRRDSTRTIAIVALVLSVLALLVPAGMFVVPMLLFAGVAAEPFDLEGPGSVTGAGSQGSAVDLEVAVRGGRAEGGDLEQVVRDDVLGGEPVSCPRTVEAGTGDVVTCTAGAEDETYVVVRFVDGRGAFTADWFSPDHSFPPGS